MREGTDVGDDRPPTQTRTYYEINSFAFCSSENYKITPFPLTFLSISVELCDMDAFIQFAASHPDSLRR